MPTKQFELSAQGRRAEKRGKLTPDGDIDFSDIPESTGEELKRARRIGRPKSRDAELMIAIRIRPSLLAKIQRAAKDEGKPYQTFIHEILEKRMSRIR